MGILKLLGWTYDERGQKHGVRSTVTLIPKLRFGVLGSVSASMGWSLATLLGSEEAIHVVMAKGEWNARDAESLTLL